MEQPLPADIENLLQDLQPEQTFNAVRKGAARGLGQLRVSDLRVVKALITAMESDPAPAVRKQAAESLRAQAHQEILQQHPDLMKIVPETLLTLQPELEKLAALEQTAAAHPDSLEDTLALADAFADQGRWRKAVETYQAALVLDPDNPDLHNDLGTVYEKVGNTELAEQAYRQAIALRPDYASAYYNLGMLYDKQKRASKAIGAFRKCLRLSTDPHERSNAGERFKSIKEKQEKKKEQGKESGIPYLGDGWAGFIFSLTLGLLIAADNAISDKIKWEWGEGGARSEGGTATLISELAWEWIRGAVIGALGALGGLLLGYLGYLLNIVWLGSSGLFICIWMGYVIGSAVGVYITGTLFYQKGSPWLTLLGGVLGAVVALPLIFLVRRAGLWWLLLPATIPPALAALGFNLQATRQYPGMLPISQEETVTAKAKPFPLTRFLVLVSVLVLVMSIGIILVRNRTTLTADSIVLRGHEGVVSSVAFSPNGRRLASAGEDRIIRLWETGNPSADPVLLTGHEEWISSLAFSPESQILASASRDKTIRLWDITRPSAAPTILTGHEERCDVVAFSPDGRSLASAGLDGTIRLWDVANLSAAPLVFTGHEYGVESVTFSPDGQILASAGPGAKVLFWDITNPNAVSFSVIYPGDPPVAFSPDGRILAYAWGGEIRLWDVANPSADPIVLHDRNGGLYTLAFSPDGRTLASASGYYRNKTIRLWDVANLSADPDVFRGHRGSVWSVTFSPDGQTLASGSADGTVRLWDVGGE